jgi:hypothetical protein
LLIAGAGHQTPVVNPVCSYTFIRDFFIGNSNVVLVETKLGGSAIVHEAPTPTSAFVLTLLPDRVLVSQEGIFDKGTTVLWPGASVAAWEKHLGSLLVAATRTLRRMARHSILIHQDILLQLHTHSVQQG